MAVTHDVQVLRGVFFCSFTSRTFFRAFSSLAWVFICCTSMVSTFLLRMNRSWFPMHSCRIWRQKDIFIHRNVTQLSFRKTSEAVNKPAYSRAAEKSRTWKHPSSCLGVWSWTAENRTLEWSVFDVCVCEWKSWLKTHRSLKRERKRTRSRSCIYLLLTVRDVADPAPGKRLVGIEFAVGAVDVKTLSVHTK